MMLPVTLLSVALQLPVVPPPAVHIVSARSAVFSESTASSGVFPAETSVFVADAQVDASAKASALKGQLDKALSDVSPVLQKAFDENAPILQQKLTTEVAPAVKQALSDAAPVIQQTASDLAPIAQEAFDVVKPVVIKGATELGKSAGGLALSAGQAALEAAKGAAATLADQAGQTLDQNVLPSTPLKDPATRKQIEDTGKALVTAATPVVEEGVRQATPLVESALKAASKASAQAGKSLLAQAQSSLDAFLADDAPAAPDAVSEKLAAAEAERQAILSKLSALTQ